MECKDVKAYFDIIHADTRSRTQINEALERVRAKERERERERVRESGRERGGVAVVPSLVALAG